MITKNIRTHKVILTDWRTLSITKSQYGFFIEQMQMLWYNDFLEIHDIDTQKLFYNWKKSWIKEFIEIANNTNNQWRRFICDFWVRHPISQAWHCNCTEEFWCFRFEFHNWLNEKWYKFFYNIDIKQDRIDEYKKINLNKIF